MIKRKIVITIFFVVLGLALTQSPCFAENKIEISYSFVTENSQEQISIYEIADFFKNLPDYYLEVHPDHKWFKIINSDIVELGSIIDNKEISGGQTVHHTYTVKEFSVTQNNFLAQLVSEKTKVSMIGVFNMEVHTIFEFSAHKMPNDKLKISSNLSIEFRNGIDSFFANLVNTKGIWEKHLKEELAGGMKVILKKHKTQDKKGPS